MASKVVTTFGAGTFIMAVPPVSGWTSSTRNAADGSGRDRGDRHPKFYEISNYLHDERHPYMTDALQALVDEHGLIGAPGTKKKLRQADEALMAGEMPLGLFDDISGLGALVLLTDKRLLIVKNAFSGGLQAVSLSAITDIRTRLIETYVSTTSGTIKLKVPDKNFARQVEEAKNGLGLPAAKEGAGASSAADELEKFAGLLAKGIISQEEFDEKKRQLLS